MSLEFLSLIALNVASHRRVLNATRIWSEFPTDQVFCHDDTVTAVRQRAVTTGEEHSKPGQMHHRE